MNCTEMSYKASHDSIGEAFIRPGAGEDDRPRPGRMHPWGLISALRLTLRSGSSDGMKVKVSRTDGKKPMSTNC